jgi:hypothetical protein
MYLTNRLFSFISGSSVFNRVPGHRGEYWKLVTVSQYGILWSKDIRKERKLNVYNALIKSSLLYGSETWRLTENKKRRVEATEMDAMRRSSRIS